MDWVRMTTECVERERVDWYICIGKGTRRTNVAGAQMIDEATQQLL